jgi:hypothetical protein
MNVKTYLKIKVIDKRGKCTYYRRYRSRSFVIGFLNEFYTNLSGQGVTSKNISGQQYTTNPGDRIVVNDGANDSSFGILIGSGTSAPTIIDYSLSILISNGTGIGQMQYGAVSITGAVTNTSTNTGYFTVTRTFTNNSGSSITVSEVGMAAFDGGFTGLPNQIYLILHDLLPTPITVPNGSSLTISYEIQVAT